LDRKTLLSYAANNAAYEAWIDYSQRGEGGAAEDGDGTDEAVGREAKTEDLKAEEVKEEVTNRPYNEMLCARACVCG
jgi:hypothetical protein